MELIKPKINSVCKYHGGKNYLAKHIIPLFPECEIFVDATVGAGNIILNIAPDEDLLRKEIAIDKDEDVIRMWQCLQKFGESIHNILRNYSYTEKSFNIAGEIIRAKTRICELQWTAAYIVRNRMSRGGLGKTFAWSDRLRGGIPGDVNGWNNFNKYHYENILLRIKYLQFIHGCMRDVLFRNSIIENSKAVVYIDPPYVKSSRTISKVYNHEMETWNRDVSDPTQELTHEGIWEMIKNAKCKFYVSGYDSDCYRDFGGKIILRKDMPNNSGQGKTKQRRVEMVWSLV